MRRVVIAVLAALALLGACSADSDSDVGTRKPSSLPFSTSVTSSSPRFVDAPQDYSASGDFENGHQIGVITAVGVSPPTVTVDFIQILSGKDATTAYREDTGETDEPANDYWTRNTSAKLRTIAVAADARITVNNLAGHEPSEHELVSFNKLNDLLHVHERNFGGDDARWETGPFGFTLKDGVITIIEQLYVP